MPEDEHREEAKAANETPRRVRSPYTRIAIGVVGVLLSVWLWVGESWRFDMTPKELAEGSPGWGWKGGWVGRYVRLTGTWTPAISCRASLSDLGPTMLFRVSQPDCPEACLLVRDYISALNYTVTRDGITNVKEHFDGRVIAQESGAAARVPAVDATRGRWTGKSVLAVFIFLWGAGIVGSSIWLWKRRREAAATAASTDHASSEG